MRQGDGWCTHNNGDRPFFVRLVENMVEVFEHCSFIFEQDQTPDPETFDIALTDKDDYTTYYKKLCTYPALWIRPSTKRPECNPDAVGDDEEAEWFEGYAVLAKLEEGNKYLCISDRVIILTLDVDEELDQDESIVSTSESNDVWYSVLRTTKATYTVDYCPMKDAASLRISHETRDREGLHEDDDTPYKSTHK